MGLMVRDGALRLLTMRVGRRELTPRPPFRKPRPRELRFGQCAPTKLITLLGDIVVDALVFEFMGLAMLGLCVVVLAVPSGRQSSRRGALSLSFSR